MCETNAYSCCRLLWRRDRKGRKVLRSAETGTDSLYHAEEAVWLSDVSTNGAYRVVQRFFDGFGRETETVTHVGTTPGEATVAYEPAAGQMPSTETVEYLDERQNGSSERIDGRGKVAYASSWRQASSEQAGESVYGADGWSDSLTTTVTRYRNGGMATERWWNGGWRREETAVAYGGNGNRIDTATVSASDHAAVTNSVTETDALGQVVETDYDVFGNVTAMRGATYSVEMDYDTENRRVALRTTRDGSAWDETRWAYDAPTGNCISKTYADGATVTYTYTPDNLPLRTTYASGRWKEKVYDSRRQIVAVEYSDGKIALFDHDAFLNEIAFSNDVASAHLDHDAKGNCTNDTAVVGDESKSTRRSFDAFSRLTGIDGTIYDYNSDGLLASISNAIALVEYAYTPDRLDAGYALTLSNGVVFSRSLLRDGYRRSLVTDISSVANGVGIGTLSYTYDALIVLDIDNRCII